MAALLSCQTSAGWVSWRDGSPPQIAVAERESDSRQGLREWRAARDKDVAPEASKPLKLVLLLKHGHSLPPVGGVLRSLGRHHWDSVRWTSFGDDPFLVWRDVEQWILSLEKYLRQTRSTLSYSYEFRTRTPQIPTEFVDFTLGRPRITVTFVDTGDSRARSLALADRAAQLADLGLRVRAELWLSRKNIAAWREWAESWLTISRSGGVDFVRPRARLPDASATLELLPPPSEVSQFLAGVYSDNRHDLWKTEPFASLLQALTCGTRSAARCGAANIMVIDSNGRPHKCEHGLGPARPGELRPCDCSWSALCDVVCAPCPALRRLAGPVEWRRWERLFCPAVQVLVPKMLAELAAAARYQRSLVSRQADQRLRVDAHEGHARIWSDRVTTAHRTPSGGENGNWDRPGRVGHDAPGVAVEGGRRTET